MRTDYNVKIVDTSIAELNPRMELVLKSTTGGIALDEALEGMAEGEGLIIEPKDYAVLEVHNEKVKEGESTDYTKYVILTDKDKYVTSSTNFFNSFLDIFETMKGSGESYSIKIFRRESRNFKGKYFLTCEII